MHSGLQWSVVRLTGLLRLQVEFEVLPRVLPKVHSFSIRVDSSLREGAAAPADVVEFLAAQAMSAAAEEGASTVDVCLQMLPLVQEAASKQFPGQVGHLHIALLGC